MSRIEMCAECEMKYGHPQPDCADCERLNNR